MTLKSDKNEPAVVLERVNSARTALSDLYLEQLLQNKPKTEQVRGFRVEEREHPCHSPERATALQYHRLFIHNQHYRYI